MMWVLHPCRFRLDTALSNRKGRSSELSVYIQFRRWPLGSQINIIEHVELKGAEGCALPLHRADPSFGFGNSDRRFTEYRSRFDAVKVRSPTREVANAREPLSALEEMTVGSDERAIELHGKNQERSNGDRARSAGFLPLCPFTLGAEFSRPSHHHYFPGMRALTQKGLCCHGNRA